MIHNQKFLPAWALALLLAVLVSGSPTRAQTDQQVLLSPPDSSEYPEISIYLDAFNRDGSLNTSLEADQITLAENGRNLDLIKFEALNPGIQLVAALNLSSPFAIQDENGISRLEKIVQGLQNWADQPADSGPDDLSLLDNAGLEAAHLSEREDFRAALDGYTPEPREIGSDLSVLDQAISLAADPVGQPGMKRVVLFFSSQPAPEDYEAINSLLNRAQANQVRIYTILISSPAFFETEGAARLQDLSDQTGGQLIPYSGEEPLVDFNQLFAPLRSTYSLTYRSQIISAGIHTLEVSLPSSLGQVSGTREFRLEVLPPNPVFLSPPRTITREAVSEMEGQSSSSELQPTTISLPVLIEFPDQLPRDLEELIFRVDGEIHQVLTAPPFDRVIWDLSGFEFSGTHLISLEAVDSQGLSRISLETPIEILVETPQPEIRGMLSENAVPLAGLGFVLGLGLVLFLLIARGRLRPGRERLISWARIRSQVRSLVSPFLQKLKLNLGTGQIKTTAQFDGYYRLVPINESARELFAEPILVETLELHLGSQPGTSGVMVSHPTVINSHARITWSDDNSPLLQDLGSSAGTWVNYRQIPSGKSQIIKDGDIIHIGEVEFRYQENQTIPTLPKQENQQP